MIWLRLLRLLKSAVEHDEGVLFVFIDTIAIQIKVSQLVQAIGIIVEQSAEREILECFRIIRFLVPPIIEAVTTIANGTQFSGIRSYLIQLKRFFVVLLYHTASIVKRTKVEGRNWHILLHA